MSWISSVISHLEHFIGRSYFVFVVVEEEGRIAGGAQLWLGLFATGGGVAWLGVVVGLGGKGGREGGWEWSVVPADWGRVVGAD